MDGYKFQEYRYRRQTIMERIFSLITYNDRGCWECSKGLNTKGYPQIHYQDKHQLVSHVVWRLMRGRIPKGKFVLHKCDNPLCINPDHLFLGTQKDNMDDMRAKGRENDWGKKGGNAENVFRILRIPIPDFKHPAGVIKRRL